MCYAMDCFGTSFTNLHMPKPVITFVFTVLRNGLLRYMLYTCPNLWLRSCSKCYAMDCFGTYVTHAQTCHYVRVQSATQWTASVHTLHMPKPVITFVFKVLRNGLLRYILYTCQTSDYVRAQSATQWTASVRPLLIYICPNL